MSQPIMRFRAGVCTASIFLNEVVSGEERVQLPSVQLQRVYRRGERFEYTTSLRQDDLPKAILVLGKAYDYLLSKAYERREKE